MDDDVKNLFQKFGQSTVGYQEIKRESGSEQAKQRWPLLRDVRIQAGPGHVQGEPAPHFLSQATPRPDVAAKPVMPVQSSPVAAQNVPQHAASSAPPFFSAQRAPSPPATGQGAAPAPASLFRTVSDQHALQNAYQPSAVGAEQPVSAVFERLAGKPQDSGKTAGPAGNSFFKKMFKP